MDFYEWLRSFQDAMSLPTQARAGPAGEGYAELNRRSRDFFNYIDNPEARAEVAPHGQRAAFLSQPQRIVPNPIGTPEVRAAGRAATDRANTQQSRAFSGSMGSAEQARDLPGQAWALLDLLAYAEGTDRQSIFDGGRNRTGYDIAYGGGRVPGLTESEHPNTMRRIVSGPDQGRNSSAANRYQFIGSTWNRAVDALRAHDPQTPVTRQMSPENQDRVTWFWASETYRRYLERNFPEIARSHDLASDIMDPTAHNRIARALSAEWASLPVGRQPRMSFEQFSQMLSRAQPMVDFLTRTAPTQREARDFLTPLGRPRSGSRRPSDFFLPQPRAQSVRRPSHSPEPR